MRQVTLTRDEFTEDSTLGLLECDTGEVFHTLELPWRGNEPFKSCIPIGNYLCKFLPKAVKRKNVWHIKGVFERDSVLIHVGNFPRNTKGCALIGLTRGDDAVYSSKIALGAFNNVMGREDFILKIQNKA